MQYEKFKSEDVRVVKYTLENIRDRAKKLGEEVKGGFQLEEVAEYIRKAA
jgi:hypothetical protein